MSSSLHQVTGGTVSVRIGGETLADLETQVAIVGGGPVGLGLGIELGRRGIETMIIEKEAELHRIPKGQNLTQRTMEHFRAWGVASDIRRARLMPVGYPAVGINAYGNLMSAYAHPWFRRSRVGEYYFEANERLPQYRTELVLRSRIAALPAVAARYGTAAQLISQDDRHVRISTDSGIVTAAYLVGCDGSRSIVAEQAEIAMERSDHDKRMVLLVFRSRELHNLLEGTFGEAAFFNVLDPDLDGYWRFLGRIDVGEGWFFHAPVATDASADTLDHERLLHESVGAEFAVDLDYIGFWDLRVAIADTYRQRRIFIAGDAAHSHPPYGGYGINTGLEDARNLGWKLAAVLQGWGGGTLLDSYTAERRAVFVSTARDFIEAFIESDREFIARHDPAEDAADFAEAWASRRSATHGVSDFEPHYEGSPVIWGPDGGSSSAVGSHSFVARPGHHLPPRGLSSEQDLFAALGDEWALIAAGDRNDAAAAFSDAAAAGGVPLAVVRDDFAGEVADYGSSLLLVRPDHYVAWVDDGSPFTASAVLERSIGR